MNINKKKPEIEYIAKSLYCQQCRSFMGADEAYQCKKDNCSHALDKSLTKEIKR